MTATWIEVIGYLLVGVLIPLFLQWRGLKLPVLPPSSPGQPAQPAAGPLGLGEQLLAELARAVIQHRLANLQPPASRPADGDKLGLFRELLTHLLHPPATPPPAPSASPPGPVPETPAKAI